jgi:hypothetical protein
MFTKMAHRCLAAHRKTWRTLEEARATPLLSRMATNSPARPGTAALLVCVATTGALLAFGRNDGEPTKAFRQAGRMLLGMVELPGAAIPATATVLGIVHHTVISLVWGALLLMAVRPFRGPRYLCAALALAVTFSLLNLWLVPPMLGVGFAVVTSIWRAVPLALAIALALLVTPWASGVPEGTSTA